MPSFHERLSMLEDDLKATPVRISAYHDLPFCVFHYDPKSEFQTRREMKLLATRLGNVGKSVLTISIAELLWEAIDSNDNIDSLADEEKQFGFERAQETVNKYLTDEAFSPLPELLSGKLSKLDPKKNVVFLNRAASLAPSIYQVSQLLGQMQGKTLVPTVIFYPGSVEGTTGLRFMDMSDRIPMGSYRVKIY
ncbi:MAG: hypothetical protein BWX92_03490 [Deltaproteobacteria bacterium ADurb.Bin135]|nr:MAG: hypothetical protein BWX92_03490 [Deltaproteobacteria bacterium ADurb.Bin135]